MKKVTPFLWYNGKAEEAARFYVSVISNSKILSVTKNASSGTGPVGKVMAVRFSLGGQEFMAFNGGPRFKFTWAFSMFVNCKDQREVDRIWGKLVRGGKPLQCGWLEDRYGLAWQIIPRGMLEMIGHRDHVKAGRAVQAMLKMVKIDIGRIRNAFDGKAAKGGKS